MIQTQQIVDGLYSRFGLCPDSLGTNRILDPIKVFGLELFILSVSLPSANNSQAQDVRSN